jgi:hypothetical protein
MPDAQFSLPPIPVYISHYPAVSGMVIPFTVLRHRNGDAALGLTDYERVSHCLRERRCGVCGRVMHGRMVFLMRQSDLRRKCSNEPGMCPPCAAYTQRACPMIAGRMDHYRKSQPQFLSRRCDDPLCLCWSWVPQSEPARYGAPADHWYALWATEYRLIRDQQGNLAAGFSGIRVLALRSIRQDQAEGG